jgi:DNA-binding CsgD family transcriptional regulator
MTESRGAAPTLVGRRTECELLDLVLDDARGGQSRALVLRGDAGMGKTALLAYVHDRIADWQVARIAGVESEMELAYSALHQLCRQWTDLIDHLPDPQRQALATVFGLSAGPPPDRFLVGLATLTLLAEASEERPLVCIVDDGQWLDDASVETLGFVARRLAAEPIAMLIAARAGARDQALRGLPELFLTGLDERDARALLLAHVRGPLDASVCDQMVAESHGNPLALIELPLTWGASGGFDPPGTELANRIEESFAQRLAVLPPEAQLLLLAAAAEPRGDPVLLHRAIAELGLSPIAADPAIDAGLLRIGARVEFVHPLARAAAYRAGGVGDRHRVHAALAEATDAGAEPDRRAWHRAQAAVAPDEDVALDLERSAGRARERGGYAATGAFLARSAELTPELGHRTRRALAAADAMLRAGDREEAARLVETTARRGLDSRDEAVAQRLRGLIAQEDHHVGNATQLLLDAARKLEALDALLARETYLEALLAALSTGRFGDDPAIAAQAVRAASQPSDPGPTDLLLDGLAKVFTDGFETGAPVLQRALALYRGRDTLDEAELFGARIAARVAGELLDDEAWEILSVRYVESTRERGLFTTLLTSLGYLASLRIHQGDFRAATSLLAESDAILGSSAGAYLTRLMLAAYRGDEAGLSQLRGLVEPEAAERGHGLILTVFDHVESILHNSLGHSEQALASARRACSGDELNLLSWALPELVEAAVRLGNKSEAVAAYERLAMRARVCGTELARGIEARARALVTDGEAAEPAYGEAIEQLARTTLRLQLARAHLLYGEWLRRRGRRVDARDQLRLAHEMFGDFGADALAERVRRELTATGEKVRRRVDETRGDLTAQEAEIARLAAEGLTNPEIGALLFLSPRTVEWHLHNVFTKVGVNSRRQLRVALPKHAPAAALR